MWCKLNYIFTSRWVESPVDNRFGANLSCNIFSTEPLVIEGMFCNETKIMSKKSNSKI